MAKVELLIPKNKTLTKISTFATKKCCFTKWLLRTFNGVNIIIKLSFNLFRRLPSDVWRQALDLTLKIYVPLNATFINFVILLLHFASLTHSLTHSLIRSIASCSFKFMLTIYKYMHVTDFWKHLIMSQFIFVLIILTYLIILL